MAYVTEELLQKALAVTKEHNLFFIEDIVSYLPCGKQTFYTHKLDEVDELKDLLEENKVTTKVKMRKKWSDSDNATLQISLMKLIGRGEERKRLSQSYTDHTTKGKSIIMTEEERNARIKELAAKLND